MKNTNTSLYGAGFVKALIQARNSDNVFGKLQLADDLADRLDQLQGMFCPLDFVQDVVLAPRIDHSGSWDLYDSFREWAPETTPEVIAVVRALGLLDGQLLSRNPGVAQSGNLQETVGNFLLDYQTPLYNILESAPNYPKPAERDAEALGKAYVTALVAGVCRSLYMENKDPDKVRTLSHPHAATHDLEKYSIDFFVKSFEEEGVTEQELILRGFDASQAISQINERVISGHKRVVREQFEVEPVVVSVETPVQQKARKI